MLSAISSSMLSYTSVGQRVVVTSLSLITLGVLLMYLSGCHTVKGVGRDIEAMGQGGQEMIDGKR